VLLIVVAVFLSGIRVPYVSLQQLSRNRTIGEITGDKEVGQTFESNRQNLSGVGFQVATFGSRENNKDVIFELRNNITDEQPLRRVVVNAAKFSDHQIYQFHFDPIENSKNKTFFASLRSPDSIEGNAITVDYQNTDEYKKVGSSLVVLQRTQPHSFESARKNGADATFVVIHEIPATEFVKLSTIGAAKNYIAAVKNDPASFLLSLKFILVSLLLIALVLFSTKIEMVFSGKKRIILLLLLLLSFGFLFRHMFAIQMPFTNDEGAYLYDARTILEGKLPGGDALAKAPVFIGAAALGMVFFGHDLMIGRYVNIVLGVLTVFPLFFLGRRFGNKGGGVAAAAVWLFTAAPALFNSYGHTQTAQMFFGSLALAFFVYAMEKKRLRLFLVAGLVFGVSIVARKSSLALGLPILILLAIQPEGWKRKMKFLGANAIGVLLVLCLFFGGIYILYGMPGVSYATGVSLAKTSIEQLSERGDLYATYSVKGILPLFREAIPLVFLALVMLGQGLEQLFKRFGYYSRLVWLLPVYLSFAANQFIKRFEEESHLANGVGLFWLLMPYILTLLAIYPLKRSENKDLRAKVYHFLPLVWFIAVAIFYAFWIKFNANYISEFMPSLALSAAIGAVYMAKSFHGKWGILLVSTLLVWANYSSAHSSYVYEHTGTFHWSSILEAAAYLKENVPKDDLVQTGAVIIPYVSGHHVPFNVSHPTWYAYGYIEPSLRNIFMEPNEIMVKTFLSDVKWFVREKLTEFSYFLEYPMIEEAVNMRFTPVAEIENLSNPITIYKRK